MVKTAYLRANIRSYVAGTAGNEFELFCGYLFVNMNACKGFGLFLRTACKFRDDFSRLQNVAADDSIAEGDSTSENLFKLLLIVFGLTGNAGSAGVKPAFRNNACSFIILAKNKCSSNDLIT